MGSLIDLTRYVTVQHLLLRLLFMFLLMIGVIGLFNSIKNIMFEWNLGKSLLWFSFIILILYMISMVEGSLPLHWRMFE
jgi:hypothetical protein